MGAVSGLVAEGDDAVRVIGGFLVGYDLAVVGVIAEVGDRHGGVTEEVVSCANPGVKGGEYLAFPGDTFVPDAAVVFFPGLNNPLGLSVHDVRLMIRFHPFNLRFADKHGEPLGGKHYVDECLEVGGLPLKQLPSDGLNSIADDFAIDACIKSYHQFLWDAASKVNLRAQFVTGFVVAYPAHSW
ncbi:hypothetical protein ES703_02314 [subsurface metagenome]